MAGTTMVERHYLAETADWRLDRYYRYGEMTQLVQDWIAQYPEIAPPTIVVRATYPGANAETVAATVSTPLEQEINGVEDMLYMSSY